MLIGRANPFGPNPSANPGGVERSKEKMKTRMIVLLIIFLAVSGCVFLQDIVKPDTVTAFSIIKVESLHKPVTVAFKGMASWYGPGFHGKKTANGEIFNQYGLTAAHKTLPYNTIVRVTNLLNNRSVVVKINDRGPFVKGRDLDLSKEAARKLGMIKKGVVPVKIEIMNKKHMP